MQFKRIEKKQASVISIDICYEEVIFKSVVAKLTTKNEQYGTSQSPIGRKLPQDPKHPGVRGMDADHRRCAIIPSTENLPPL